MTTFVTFAENNKNNRSDNVVTSDKYDNDVIFNCRKQSENDMGVVR